jgi:hypothetical protein
MSDHQEKPGRDSVEFGPDIGDGTHASIRHRPDGTLEFGAARIVKQGENIAGSHIVFATRAEDGQFDIVDELDMTEAAPSERGAGPAKVTTDAYRDGWDRIFSRVKPALA